MSLKEYKPGSAFSGRARPHIRHIRTGLAGAQPCQGGHPQRALHHTG